ncbi:MAG: glycosyl transferase family 1 [Candidatus Nitrosocaldaceae archaeon]|nr:MAG: glycosyl transferase family 1 [Candidatus Nitrosocaldaceae archaeon]
MVKKYRIAFITPEFLPVRGGVSVYSLNLIKHLLNDNEVHVITTIRGKEPEKDLEYINNSSLHIHRLVESNDTLFSHLKFQFKIMKEFDKLNSKYKFDLIHSNFPSSPDLLYLLLKNAKIPVIATIHGTINMLKDTIIKALNNSTDNRLYLDASEKAILRYNKFLNIAEKLYIKHVDHFIAVSEYAKSLLSVNNVSVVHHGIDPNLFSYKENKDEHISILFISRFALHKGIRVLLDAIPLILREIPDAKIMIAGNTDNKYTIDKLKKVLPNKNAEYIGFVENYTDLPMIYKKASIFISTSFEDLLGFRLLEAMSCGVPVIATDIGGVPEVIRDGFNGFLFKPNDHKTLAEYISLLTNDYRLRNKLRKNARDTIEQRFTAKRMSDDTTKIYDEVINNIVVKL